MPHQFFVVKILDINFIAEIIEQKKYLRNNLTQEIFMYKLYIFKIDA